MEDQVATVTGTIIGIIVMACVTAIVIALTIRIVRRIMGGKSKSIPTVIPAARSAEAVQEYVSAQLPAPSEIRASNALAKELRSVK